MAREWSPDNIFDVLADARVRAILIATTEQTRSVQDLNKVLDASQSSIYRRVDVLVDYGLLAEQTKVDSDGHHYTVFRPNFEKVEITLGENTITVTLHPDGIEFEFEPDDE